MSECVEGNYQTSEVSNYDLFARLPVLFRINGDHYDLSDKHIDYLVNQNTLKRCAGMNLQERCRHFN